MLVFMNIVCKKKVLMSTNLVLGRGPCNGLSSHPRGVD